MKGLKDLYKNLVNLIFPARCPYCDGIVTPFGERIHTDCIRKMKLQKSPYCLKCGRGISGDEKYCKDCRERKHDFLRGRCLYEYSSAAHSIYRFKYGGRREYAAYYGEQIGEYFGDFIKRAAPDALVPIPIHKKRYAKRGYNQAQLLADEISRAVGVPVLPDLLKRTRNTIPLKLLSPEERQKNLKNAFIVSKNSVELKTIILIDDIYTTGATMDEASRTLHRAGIPDVYFVALTGGRGL